LHNIFKQAIVSIAFNFNTLSFIFLAAFGIMLVIQLVYLWAVYGRVAFYKNKHRNKENDELEPVSIVICTQDDYVNLSNMITTLLQQDYPDFEIVVVNDCSMDETEQYLKDMERREPRVKPVQLSQHLNFFQGKKFPLSMGIKSAKNDLLIFTDMSSMPDSNQWLRNMVNCYGKDTEIVIGYSPFERRHTLLNQLIRFDSMFCGIQYLSAALCRHPFMGVENNLSYRKNLFYRHKGFISHYNISLGGDDLFINQAATKSNTEVLIDPANPVVSKPKTSLAAWLRQKARRYYTFHLYKASDRLRQSIFTWSHFLFYACFIVLLCLGPAFTIAGMPILYIPAIVLLFLLRYISQLIVFKHAADNLSERGLMVGLVAYDALFAIFTPLLRLMGKMKIGFSD